MHKYSLNEKMSDSLNDTTIDSDIFFENDLPNFCNDKIFMVLQENSVNDELLNQFGDEDMLKHLNDNDEEIKNDAFRTIDEECQSYRTVKCNMCEQVFTFRADFDKHYSESYGLHPVYTCTFCNKTAEKYSTFRSHCYRHITEGRFKCESCPKGFNLKSLLHVHVLTKHTKIKPFSCDQCGKKFVTKPGLTIHQKKHIVETREDYPCVICGKILRTRGGLTSHMNVHRLGRRFMCDVCGRTFTQKVNMQQHVKQHTGDKPYACRKCDKKFVEKSHLSRHNSLHSDQRPHKCEICQKMYKTERCLKVHSLIHATERPFVCNICNKSFLSSTKLKQHSNIHTGERPYQCKYCDRTFTNYPNLLKHTRRKHKTQSAPNAEDNEVAERVDSNFDFIPASENTFTHILSSESSITGVTCSNNQDSMDDPNLVCLSTVDDKSSLSHLIHFPVGIKTF